jgi:fructokinase
VDGGRLRRRRGARRLRAEAEETLREVDGDARRPGGAPANVAVDLARLGSPPAFRTGLGDDAFGELLAERK